MKKILGVSFAAMLAVSPMMANAAPAVATGTSGNITAKTAQEISANTSNMATASYVMGAYNAIAAEHNKIISDITVESNGTYIGAGKDVATNLEALDAAVSALDSAASDAYVTKSSAAATSTNHYATGDGEHVGANLDALDAQVYLNTQAIGDANSGLTKAIADEVSRAEGVEGDLDDLTTTNKSSLVGAINAVNTAVSNLSTDAGNTYQTLEDSNVSANGTYNHIQAGNEVGSNLIALDTAVGVIEDREIPYVSDWSLGTVATVKISDLGPANP